MYAMGGMVSLIFLSLSAIVVYSLLFRRHKKHTQVGDLFVVGYDTVSIPLDRLPSRCHVGFADDCTVVPCNPQHYDYVWYEIKKDYYGCWALVISWNVSDVRKITYKLTF